MGKQVQAVAQAVAAADPAALDRRLPAPARRPSRSTAPPVPLRGGRPDRHRDPARGLDRRQRPAASTVALDLTLTPELERAGPGPRGRPAGAGGAQEQRPGGQRPDRAVVDRRRRRSPRRWPSTPSSWPARCWPPRCTPGRPATGPGIEGPAGSRVLAGPRLRPPARSPGARSVVGGCASRGRASRSARCAVGCAGRAGGEPVGAGLVDRQRDGRPAGQVGAPGAGGSAGARRRPAPRRCRSRTSSRSVTSTSSTGGSPASGRRLGAAVARAARAPARARARRPARSRRPRAPGGRLLLSRLGARACRRRLRGLAPRLATRRRRDRRLRPPPLRPRCVGRPLAADDDQQHRGDQRRRPRTPSTGP